MRQWGVVLVAITATVALNSSASAFGVAVESFTNWSAFQASPLYTYINTQMAGGVAGNCGINALDIQQGVDAVPASSAGGPGNATVSAAVDGAVSGTPTAFCGSPDTSAYEQQFVSLGNATSGPLPYLSVALPDVPTTFSAGYLGYEVAIFDLGKNLAPGSGNRNTERTTFSVQWSGEPIKHAVGSITNTGGDGINVILLDLDGLPDAPAIIDRVWIDDASGANPPQKGSLDVDGVLRLTQDLALPTVAKTWGSVKAFYRN